MTARSTPISLSSRYSPSPLAKLSRGFSNSKLRNAALGKLAGSGGNSHGGVPHHSIIPSFASHLQTLAPWQCIQRPTLPSAHAAWLFAHHIQFPPIQRIPVQKTRRQRLLAVYSEQQNPPPPPHRSRLLSKLEACVPNYPSIEESKEKLARQQIKAGTGEKARGTPRQ